MKLLQELTKILEQQDNKEKAKNKKPKMPPTEGDGTEEKFPEDRPFRKKPKYPQRVLGNMYFNQVKSGPLAGTVKNESVYYGKQEEETAESLNAHLEKVIHIKKQLKAEGMSVYDTVTSRTYPHRTTIRYLDKGKQHVIHISGERGKEEEHPVSEAHQGKVDQGMRQIHAEGGNVHHVDVHSRTRTELSYTDKNGNSHSTLVSSAKSDEDEEVGAADKWYATRGTSEAHQRKVHHIQMELRAKGKHVHHVDTVSKAPPYKTHLMHTDKNGNTGTTTVYGD